MDVIRFERFRQPDGVETAEVFINGTSLVELVRAFEVPLGTAEGHPTIAGGYCGLETIDAAPPSRLFLGEPRGVFALYGERTQVLLCDGCYEPGCWPLVCRIDVAADRVTWSSFQQPHRNEPIGNQAAWSYEGFGPFEFDRAQYEAALATLGSDARR